MGFLRGYIRRPQRVWLRRFNFQIHLWIGLLLTVYLLVIGFTGSILVFREELERVGELNPWSGVHFSDPLADPAHPLADPAMIAASVRAAFPEARMTTLSAPSKTTPVYVAVLQSRGRDIGTSRIAVHPVTGQVLGRMPRRVPNRSAWLSVVRNLHETLLSGVKGRQVNGALAALLLLVNVTGMVVWWPGVKTWSRALTVDFRRTWRRVNFDLHRAVGFWTFAVVSFWAISGVYFGWSGEARALIDRVSPLVSSIPPAVRVEPVSPSGVARVDLHAILTQASELEPRAALREIAFPTGRTAPIKISMQRAGTIGAEFVDTLYFNPYDGSYLTTWKYGVNQSLGDWIVWLQIPLHFGTFWGLGVKILWSTLGLAIPLLCLTGMLMYWNRFLRKRLSLGRTEV